MLLCRYFVLSGRFLDVEDLNAFGAEIKYNKWEIRKQKEKRSGGSCTDMGKLKSGRSHTHGRDAQTCTQKKRREPHFCAHFPTLAHVPPPPLLPSLANWMRKGRQEFIDKSADHARKCITTGGATFRCRFFFGSVAGPTHSRRRCQPKS